MNWNDLKILLTLAQSGSLTATARELRIDKTTVSRRLTALERDLGLTLTERTGRGAVRLASSGVQIARRAERMGDAESALRAYVAGHDEGYAGSVRVTAVPIVANHILLPSLPGLLSSAPGLRVELISEARDLNLLDGEADVALRLARPAGAGQGVLVRKLGELEYEAYARADVRGDLPWLGYDSRMAYLRHAEAIEDAARCPEETRHPVSFNDAETLFQATLAGYGKALLPRTVGDADPRLCKVACPVRPPGRELWLMVRRDLRGLGRIDRVIDWLDRIVKERL